MIARLLQSVFGLFNTLAGWFSAREQRAAGRAVERAEVQQDIIQTVEKANEAIAIPDADRDDRLRSRFDRARKPSADQ